MAGYVYKPRQIDRWDPLAQATLYRAAFQNEERNTEYWKARCLKAEANLPERVVTRIDLDAYPTEERKAA